MPEETTPKKKTPRSKKPARTQPRSALAIKEAERALARKKSAHRNAFRVACVKLFNDYGYALEATGTEGAQLTITELRTDNGYAVEALIADIPE